MSGRKGAAFFKADIHVHTPGSLDYQDKAATASQIVAGAIAQGLEILAVTDHNSVAWVDQVRGAAKRTGLVVFPGVEITTPVCHMLAIFDRDTPKADLEDFLSSVEVPPALRGKEQAVSSSIEAVLAEISRRKGIAIAAHANSDKGLIQNKGSKQYSIGIYNRDDLAGIELTKQADVIKFTKGQVPSYRPKACVQGSDSHSLAEIGRRFTYLKMDGLSLRGIQQALLDFEVRIRFEWSGLVEPSYPQLLRFAVNQGFFAGQVFEFHPNLNCFVGGKGVGKSTVVEFLRYAFGDVSNIEDIAEDNQGKIHTLLGEGGTIQVEYLDLDGETKSIEAEFSDQLSSRTIRDSVGAPSEIVSAPVFFSQGELTRIGGWPTD